MSKWRPIEIAPRDGRAILVVRKNCGYPIIVKWNSNFMHRKCVNKHTVLNLLHIGCLFLNHLRK